MMEQEQGMMAQAAGKEVAPANREIIPIMAGEKSLDTILADAEKQVTAMKRMTELALRVTNVNDWTDQNGKPYLEYTGSRKVAKIFGLSIRNVMSDKTTIEDEKGHKYIIFTFTGDSEWNGESVPELGTCSTKDKFFAERTKDGKKYFLPLSEIDITNVMKKGHTNFMNRAIKARLGLSFTWEEIESATEGRITRQKCSGVSYGQGKRGGSTNKPLAVADQDKQRECWEWILEYAQGDVNNAKQILANMTAFKGKEGNMVPGVTDVAKLSAARLKYLYPRVKKEIEAYRLMAKNGSPDNMPPTQPPPPTEEGQ